MLNDPKVIKDGLQEKDKVKRYILWYNVTQQTEKSPGDLTLSKRLKGTKTTGLVKTSRNQVHKTSYKKLNLNRL